MKKPMCDLCGTVHYTYEPHDMKVGRVTPAVTYVTEERNAEPLKLPPVTLKRNDKVEPVTQAVTNSPFTPQSVTPPVTLPHCPTCTCGKKRTNAERQAAYRKRKEE